MPTRWHSITVRPLRRGDIGTVQTVFDQLGERSRRFRFGTAKPALTRGDLELLARVDSRRHVLVAYAGRTAVGMAHLARDEDDPASAEIGLVVADQWQALGIGSRLARGLAIEAQRAGITSIHAAIDAENPIPLSILRAETTIVGTRIERGVLHVVGLLDSPPAAGRCTGARRAYRRTVRVGSPAAPVRSAPPSSPLARTAGSDR
jgi:GNAT superfamily N-acetyltransferase